MKDKITKEAIFPYPIDTVWNAISKEEEISAWFIRADFKAQTGYRYTFTGTGEDDCTQITGEVKKADPYTLIYTWIVQGTTVETTVKWVLEKAGSDTKLYLEHSGISGYSGETAIHMFNSFDGGWADCFSKLEKFLHMQVTAN